MVNQNEVNPHNIVLEITETALIENFTMCIAYLTEFRKLGFQIALDDFETGYSSLSSFKRLPNDCIKINDIGYDYAQGYLFSKPLLEEELVKYLEELS